MSSDSKGGSSRRSEPLVADSECWHVIERKRLLVLLRHAHGGEDPDLLYIEEYVNAKRENVDE